MLTFQESPGDVWDGVRQRLQTPRSRLRAGDASFLVHSLLDAIVDSCFPMLEHYGDRLEDVEGEVLERADARVDPGHPRAEARAAAPAPGRLADARGHQRAAARAARLHERATRTYMRDVYDHAVQIIDIVETYREVAMGLTETYMTAMSNRLNEVMKVLTIIGTIFIPLTFLAGVYGMNFQYFPELHWRWGYAVFWAISLVTAGLMIAWFRKTRVALTAMDQVQGTDSPLRHCQLARCSLFAAGSPSAASHYVLVRLEQLPPRACRASSARRCGGP